jgi:hypothetical protein
MMNKRMLTLPVIAIISISVVGIAFAHWSDMVTIKGTLDMGSLTLAFDYVEPPLCEEYYLDPITGILVPGEWKDKDVGSIECYYKDYIEDVHTLKEGWKTLVIEVDNAYPQYIVHTTFKLHNIGTVPINVCGYVITGEKRDSTTGAVIYDLLWYDPDGDYIGELYEDVNGNGVVDTGGPDLLVINLEVTNAVPYQVDPCDTNKAQIDLDFKQEAEECHTYTIHVSVLGVQWNKPCPP